MSYIEAETRELEPTEPQDHHMPLTRFIEEFGDGLLDAVQSQNPAVYSSRPDPHRDLAMAGLLRKPFPAQRDVVQAVTRLLVDENQPAAVINAEMGTGKTMMAIAAAAVMHREGYGRSLVIVPPHLVYKWRREIRETVPEARVWILNGPDTLRKLLQIRAMRRPPSVPEFFVMGRVRMRMGFNWRPAFITRKLVVGEGADRQRVAYAACPKCGEFLSFENGEPLAAFMAPVELNATRRACTACGERLWTLVHRVGQSRPKSEMLKEALTQIPTIGDKTAQRLVSAFGEDLLAGMLEDNVFEFINLMNAEGDLFFNDRQARRMERAMANMEFSFGQGGYQPTEFIKRQLPQGYFGLLVVDEGHEYKNEGSAQGQAMGVLARKCSKTLLLTGTLMGGYADDLFYLLWRLNPRAMIEDGFGYSARSSLGPAAMQFMREHGVLKDIYKESESTSHRTAQGPEHHPPHLQGTGFRPQGDHALRGALHRVPEAQGHRRQRAAALPGALRGGGHDRDPAAGLRAAGAESQVRTAGSPAQG